MPDDYLEYMYKRTIKVPKAVQSAEDEDDDDSCLEDEDNYNSR